MTRPTPDPDADLVQLAFDELGRMSFAEHSLESVLQRVTDLAARVLSGDPAISVTIVADGRSSTVAASDPLALDLDLVQYAQGSGPCMEAATTGAVVELLDTAAEQRWGPFPQAAAERGCRGVLSFPLPPQELITGGLNVYARTTRPLDEQTRRTAARFAAYAVVPVSNMYLYETAVGRAEHLRAALDSRAVIDQAKGILMERYKWPADRAFSALAELSMETNRKVRDIAEQFVQTGELPSA
ncbi:GAF and ANTAR domain-containing protein [Modestobacter sp. VKM Ac-2979]|uniref:GAF and ANTAR domain-containing protein n=1 Tax=unclassified Modestobacter TaxID=2643866 RepID=UPI0022AB7EDB|nr:MULTISPECIES: GAF and ANTAR domain-containing protein [unclassified Modestobacter]MCZ2809968.1 GAF and ANTAR domain-containing protein [Modestobacter sp. VKM Ac-2979]MCZ2842617.1 GAF and ANTAR domain-containing protein [Modestobacter sp. VKM Ac-2980]